MTAAVPDPRFRDQLAEELRATILHALLNEAPVWEIEFAAGPGLAVGVADAALVAAREVEARVQAAANQRAAVVARCGNCDAITDTLPCPFCTAANQRAAEELRSAADDLANLCGPRPWERLRGRAAALDASQTGGGQ